MEYSPMKECDIFNLPTFKPTQISPQNPHHQLPKVHKKKKSPKQFPKSDPRKKLTLKKRKILDLRRSRRTMRPDSDPNRRKKEKNQKNCWVKYRDTDEWWETAAAKGTMRAQPSKTLTLFWKPTKSERRNQFSGVGSDEFSRKVGQFAAQGELWLQPSCAALSFSLLSFFPSLFLCSLSLTLFFKGACRVLWDYKALNWNLHNPLILFPWFSKLGIFTM